MLRSEKDHRGRDIRVAKNIVAWQEKRAMKKSINKTSPSEYMKGNKDPSNLKNGRPMGAVDIIKEQYIHEDELHTILRKFNKEIDGLTNDVQNTKTELNETLLVYQNN
jgi:septation ring formation regulator EzrA